MIVEPCPVEALELHRRATCGFVPVPLDRTRPNGTKIRIYFERYPRRLRNQPRLSTVVSIEGGPGYPVTPDRDRPRRALAARVASPGALTASTAVLAGTERSALRLVR